MESARLVTVGQTFLDGQNGTAVQADATFLNPVASVRVTLTSDYQLLYPPGWPGRPEFRGKGPGSQDYPHRIASGTTMAFLKPEADAIVGAGGGTYA
jgi:hypothetical protein